MKLLFPLLILALPLSVLAQEPKDSLSAIASSSLSDEDIKELTAPIKVEIPSITSLTLENNWKKDLSESGALTSPSENVKPMEVRWYGEPLFPKGTFLPAWKTGYMYGSHSYQGSFMHGYVATANAGIYQNLGDYWNVNTNVELQKYSVYYNTAVFNGSVTWHPSRYFALTAFGYYSPGSFLSPMNIGQSFQWGGYATLQSDTDVPFGVDVGARQTYDSYTGHEVIPIVQPFVKLGGAKLGIDFGPIIKNALWKSKGGGGHPGIGPIPQPIKAIPTVAPRR
jgi:hypothetical protein